MDQPGITQYKDQGHTFLEIELEEHPNVNLVYKGIPICLARAEEEDQIIINSFTMAAVKSIRVNNSVVAR